MAVALRCVSGSNYCGEQRNAEKRMVLKRGVSERGSEAYSRVIPEGEFQLLHCCGRVPVSLFHMRYLGK
jgi:hypothetical protein